MASIGETAAAHQGRTTGFDYLRLGLALAVVIFHCLIVDSVFWGNLLARYRPATALILPAFFALSGYLVTGSLVRNTIPEFITLRIIRLVPALAFEITLSALLIGSFFTRLPADQYYTNPFFTAYFLNIIGDVHMYLPGVFNGEQINSQLWTIPFELRCYLLIIGVSLVRVVENKIFFPLALLCTATTLTASVYFNSSGWAFWHLSGRALVCTFLWACTIYVYRDRIWYSRSLAIGSMAAAVIILFSSRYEALATIPIAYVTVYIGLMTLPRIGFGDLSYGLFLFHYPVLQALRFGPEISNRWALIGSTILVSGVCALVSWNLVEKPILARKGFVVSWINSIIALLSMKMRLGGSAELASASKEIETHLNVG